MNRRQWRPPDILAPVEEITCPFCDTSGDEALHQDGWTARRCPSCRLVFLSPRPEPADTEKLYVEDAAHWPASTHLMDYGSPANRLETERTMRLLRRHKPAGRLLEIGPGSGALLAAARSAGYEVAAVELNPVQVAFIRDVLDVPCAASLEEVDGLFDIVYHRDVLSHFSDPVSVFEQIFARLRPGGVHIFETGNGDFAPRYERLFSSFQFPDHLFFFSSKSISLLLERTGFVHLETLRYALVPFLLGQRLLARGRPAKTQSAPPQAAAVDPEPASGLARTLLGRTKYVLRYGAGSLAPKHRRPFTMIVVASRPS